MTSYHERMQHDPAFRAFVQAQQGQAAVEAASLRVVVEQQREVIEAQTRELKELRAQVGVKGRKK